MQSHVRGLDRTFSSSLLGLYLVVNDAAFQQVYNRSTMASDNVVVHIWLWTSTADASRIFMHCDYRLDVSRHHRRQYIYPQLLADPSRSFGTRDMAETKPFGGPRKRRPCGGSTVLEWYRNPRLFIALLSVVHWLFAHCHLRPNAKGAAPLRVSGSSLKFSISRGLYEAFIAFSNHRPFSM